jgi:hypothetical protein
MQFEVINIGTIIIPQNVNLGKNCSSAEKQDFIKIFKEYKDIFSGTYDNIKTYYTKII